MQSALAEKLESDIASLLASMSLPEKIGQLRQVDGTGMPISDLFDSVRNGSIGSIINLVDVELSNELQRVAVEESRTSVPLVFARDVIHGFKTVFPIPLGQAATWNPELVEECTRIAAHEAGSSGVHWTFAPMIDVSRDPRWGRIAESFGEDAYMNAIFGSAVIRGFQGTDLTEPGTIAACAKHFVGYGASEAGIDYSSTNISENELRNVHLVPFKAALDAGVVSVMTSLSDIDGIPATANRELMRDVLRDEWGFEGLVVSDWDSIRQLSVHGITTGDRESAIEAVEARIDIEMTGDAYQNHLAQLIDEGAVSIEQLDAMVMNVLALKNRLGLFENPYTNKNDFPEVADDRKRSLAKQSATESVVLLKNDRAALPLVPEKLNSVCIVGPMADEPYEQLGTWIFDGDPGLSVTPLQALVDYLDDECTVVYERALETTRSTETHLFDPALAAAKNSDVIIAFLGEEAILSGEAHCRAEIDLPGAQVELLRELKKCGKPVIAVILAGRPLTLSNMLDLADAVLFAWHPGTMAGPALADILFGVVSPSGKLPVTFPKSVGQIPAYYSKKNTGRPATEDTIVRLDEIPTGAQQTSFGMTAFHLDDGIAPLFPFGHGLSYAEFEYSDLQLSSDRLDRGEELVASVSLRNSGAVAATEVVQLYIRDRVGSTTRPIKELKGFKRVALEPGETATVEFSISERDLEYYQRSKEYGVEPGEFDIWVGGSSDAPYHASFDLI